MFFLFLNLTLSAQVFQADYKELVQIKDRKLLVILREVDPKRVQGLSGLPAKLEVYKNQIEFSNSLLKELVPTIFTSRKEIEFKTLDQAKLLNKQGCSDYFTLIYSFTEQDKKLSREVLIRDIKDYGSFDIRLLEKFHKDPIFTFYTPTSIPSEGDFTIALQQLVSFITIKLANPAFSDQDYLQEVRTNSYTLQKKVLLVDSAMIDKHSKSYDYIREEYSSEYELADFKKISEVIKNKDTNYVYLAIVPYNDQISRGGTFEGTNGGGMDNYSSYFSFAHFIIDPLRGDLVSFVKSEEKKVVRRNWRQYLKFLDNE